MGNFGGAKGAGGGNFAGSGAGGGIQQGAGGGRHHAVGSAPQPTHSGGFSIGYGYGYGYGGYGYGGYGGYVGYVSTGAIVFPAQTVSQALTDFAKYGANASISIADAASDVTNRLDALQSLVAAGSLSSITLTDSGTPTLTITAAQESADSGVLGDIGTNYNLAITDVAAAAAVNVASMAHVVAVQVNDSAANIAANLASLQGLASAGKISGITFTDTGYAVLSLTPAQLTDNSAAIADMTGNFYVREDASAANLTVNGLSGHGTEVVFTGPAGEYSIASGGNGSSVIVTDVTTGRASVDNLTGVTALQFSDLTDFLAQAPSTTTVTAGNLIGLYAAVFGRTPDIPGLAYYENQLQSNPSMSLTQYAGFFLSSPEYVGNTAHNYAQNTTGDTQFITDIYYSLLHRAPDVGALPFYLNVISQFDKGLSPGTPAYASAELAAHAQVITYVSQSAEFFSDVTVTAQNPSSPSHWLVLV